MRGSCSPTSMSTTRRDPTKVLMVTRPGWSATTSPILTAPARLRSGAHRSQDRLGLLGGHERDQAALVGDVHRVEAEQLARGGDGRGHGHRGFVDLDCRRRTRRRSR